MTASASNVAQRPLVGASVLVRDGGRVLLVKRGRPPLAGLWSLPGGRVELGERLEEAAIREIREETGLTIDGLERIDLAEVISRNPAGAVEAHIVLTVFAAGSHSGTPVAGDDAADVGWFGPEAMAGLAMTDDSRRVVETHGFDA